MPTLAASRAVLVGGRPKMLREMPRPIFVAHRMVGSTGYGPYPENAVESGEMLLLDGSRAFNYDGNAALSDGTIANLHDTTVDRTLTGTGNVSSFTPAAYKALFQDTAKSWGPGMPTTWHPRTFEEVMTYWGARVTHCPEVGVAGAGATVAAMVTARGLRDYYQVISGQLTDLAAFRAAGISSVYLPPGTATVATLQSTWPATNGPVGIDFYNASPPGGSIDTYIQALVTAGYTVQVYSINRKSDALSAIASAAAAGGVLDAVISNDPIFHDTRIWTRRTTDSFATGKYSHGLVGGSGGSIPRGVFTGTTPNRFGFTSAIPTFSVQVYFHLGEISPLPANCTITWTVTIDGISSAAGNYVGALLHATNDQSVTIASGKPGGYLVRLNQSGTLQLYTIAAGTGTSIQQGATQGGSNPALTNGQQITLRLTTTSTQVTLTRLDTGDTITVTNSTFRGGYAHFGKAGSSAVAFTDGVLTSGSAVVTSATATFNTATDVGKLITGTGIPAATTILSVQSATQATMSANATTSGNPVTINVSRPNIYCTYSSIGVT